MTHKILVLPGIGDIYWVAVALQSFMQRHRLDKPDVYVWNFDGRPRSLEYVARLPFVNAVGYWDHTHKVPGFRQSYATGPRVVFPNFYGFRFYLSANGALRTGRTMSKAWAGFSLNWDVPFASTEAETEAAESAKAEYGDYVVAYLSDHGMFSKWVSRWGVKGCVELVKSIRMETGCKVLLTGSAWDAPFAAVVAEACDDDGVVDLSGQTALDALIGLLKSARGTVGWCGGNTIHSVHVKTPTLIVWSTEMFADERFHANACRPDALGHWYRTAVVERDAPQSVATRFAEMLS